MTKKAKLVGGSIVILIMLGLVMRTARQSEAAMVDFESPLYMAGVGFDGVDGWENFAGATTVITPDAGGSGDTSVLAGSQSGRLDGSVTRSIMLRLFDEGTTWGDGTSVVGQMQVDGATGGYGAFYFSHDTARAATPAGIAAVVGANFTCFAEVEGELLEVDSGVAVASGANYQIELLLDITNQKYDAYVTNLTASGPRTTLGTDLAFGVNPDDSVGSEDFATSGFALVANVGAVAVFDELDIFSDSTPLDGDLNDDGFVGGDDLDIVRSFWGQTVPQGDLSKGDPSNDGFVGGDDLDIVRANWGQGNPPAAGAVPEPGTLLLLFAGAVCLSAVSRGGRLTKKDCRG